MGPDFRAWSAELAASYALNCPALLCSPSLNGTLLYMVPGFRQPFPKAKTPWQAPKQ